MDTTGIWYDPAQERNLPTVTTSTEQNLISIGELACLALPDVSGSTAGQILFSEYRMVDDFKASNVITWTDHAIPMTPAAFKQTRSQNDTQPSKLFHDPENSQDVVQTNLGLIHDAELIVFSTDGEVNQREIQNFAILANEHMSHTPLLVCVLCIRSDMKPPGSVSVSVFAPLLTFQNVIMLQLCPVSLTYRVMGLSNNIRAMMRLHVWKFNDERLQPDVNLDTTTLTDRSDWTKLPTLTPEELLSCVMERPHPRNAYVKLRTGYRMMSSGMAFSLDNLFKMTVDRTDGVRSQSLVQSHPAIWERLTNEFSDIVRLCKNEARLPQLRAWVNDQKSFLLNKLNNLSSGQLTVVVDPEIIRLQSEVDINMLGLIEHRRSLEWTEKNDPDSPNIDFMRGVLNDYRRALRFFLKDLREAEEHATKQVTESPEFVALKQHAQDTLQWLKLIHEAEATGYSSSDVLRGLGNRAKRATEVNLGSALSDQLHYPKTVGLRSIDWTGAPMVECPICCETANGCFILRHDPSTPEQRRFALDINGSDYCMNCPLAHGPVNLLFLSSDILCVNCAQYLVNHGGRDTVRSIITGVMPIAGWEYNQNSRYFTAQLGMGLGEGKQLPHLHLLWFALLDSASQLDWAKSTPMVSNLFRYSMASMMANVNATYDFTDRTFQCKLGQAFDVLMVNMTQRKSGLLTQPLMNQPIEAVLVVVRQWVLVNNSDSMVQQARRVLAAKYTRLLIERYCARIKPHKDDHTITENVQRSTTRMLMDALYDCDGLGVPRFGSGQLVLVPEICSITRVLIPAHLSRRIEKECSQEPLSQLFQRPALITPAHLTLTLHALLNEPYDRVESVIDRVALSNGWLVTALISGEAWTVSDDTSKSAVDHLNTTMFKQVLSKDRHENLDPNTVPGFVSIVGPSVLHCVCGHSFRGINPLNVVEGTRQQRAMHFEEVYGEEVPGPRSLHVHTYRTCMRAVRAEFPRTAQHPDVPRYLSITRDMVLSVLAHLFKRGINGTCGNVFRLDLVKHVALLLVEYLKVWRAHPYQPALFKNLDNMSFGDKVEHELALGHNGNVPTLSLSDADPVLGRPLSEEEMLSVLPVKQMTRRI